MLDWVISAAGGLLLGVWLYLMVRVRGVLIPYSILQVGDGARRWVWLIMMTSMIIGANIALIGLRKGLLFMVPNRSTLKYEIGFAAISFSLAMFLVTRRACQRDCSLFPEKS